ncbi:MAG: hypothetical protein COB16_17225 [Rhodobacteraceae bacterium]|nr:MAG: hypothetical protein COB16_17225 [Paracoccaceae bacterium]
MSKHTVFRPPDASENNIAGAWNLVDDHMIADETCERIEWLIQDYFERVSFEKDGWTAIYLDPRDQGLWRLEYPHGEMHGSGPLSLTRIPTHPT